MKRRLKKYKCTLTLQSPVHIGSHVQSVNKLEFLDLGDEICMVDISRLTAFLSEKLGPDVINDFTTYISQAAARGGNKQVKGGLTEFIEGCKLSVEETAGEAGTRRIRILSSGRRINEFMPLIRDGFIVPYIPGSSIKGAVRTALMANLYERKGLSSRFPEPINDKKKKEAAKPMEKKAFGTDPNHDIMRSVRIGDAYCKEEAQTAIMEVQVITTERVARGTAERKAVQGATPLFEEVLPPGQRFAFEITIEEGLAEAIERGKGFTSKEILVALNSFYCKVFEDEARVFSTTGAGGGKTEKGALVKWIKEKYPGRSFTLKQQEQLKEEFEREKGDSRPGGSLNIIDGDFSLESIRSFYGNEPANIRIGSGSGLKSVSMLMNLNHRQRVQVAKILPNPHGKKGEPPADWSEPISRKFVMRDKQPWLPLGWCRLDLG